MVSLQIILVTILCVAGGLSLSLVVIALTKSTPYARSFVIYGAGTTIWAFAHAVELLSPESQGKMLAVYIVYLGVTLTAAGMASFIFTYAITNQKTLKLLRRLTPIPLIIGLILLWTNQLHHGFYREFGVNLSGPFPSDGYILGPIFWLYVTYAYGLMTFGLGILVWLLFKLSTVYRLRVVLLIIGIVVGFTGSILHVSGLSPVKYADITPLSFTLTGLFFGWPILQERLLDVVPIARDIILKNLSDIAIVLDTNHHIVDLNPAAKEFLGKERRQVIGQPFDVVLADYPAIIGDFPEHGKVKTEIELNENGVSRFFELFIDPVIDFKEQVIGWTVIAHDITKSRLDKYELEAYRSQLEELVVKRTEKLTAINQSLQQEIARREKTETALWQAYEQLKELDRMKDEFVANVSHELRTPVTSIKLYHLLLKSDNEKKETYFNILERETDRLVYIIEGLLDISQLTQKQVEPALVETDLNAVLGQHLEDREVVISGKKQVITYAPADVPPDLMLDPVLIERVFSLLLTNAINYTTPTDTITIKTHYYPDDAQYTCGFSITDSGPGISADEIDHIFDRFYRGRVGSESQLPGIGLGLTIARDIVNVLGGEISVESQPGVETTFTVVFP